ncbi:hypothetical protein BDQ17DRAFT_384872 [Cyathus striatus]|nr:hypothetical protein BDQ17DRAFT_384872 [Cyathus striatus]
MSLTSWLWGTSQLDDAIATSELMPVGSEDIALNLEICDQIRSKSVSAKDAMRALKRRLNHKNPNVQLLALSLTDICIKNGGDHFLVEVASREFMDNLVSILKIPTLNTDLKNTILRLIQNWSVAFEGKPSLSYASTIYNNLSREGYKFPPKDMAVANSAMVDTQTAPEWIDSDVCLRCRTPFTFTNRKHHCRNCGQVFDQQCSSKTMALPHYGITQEVRVCDTCYSKLSKKAEKVDKPHKHSHSHLSSTSRARSARELDDAELQRAIQLSLEELNMARGSTRSEPAHWHYSEPPIVDRTTYPSKSKSAAEEDDPDLRAAIEASLREANALRPSAPVSLETPKSEEPPYGQPAQTQSDPYALPSHPPLPKIPSYDLGPMEEDTILTFNQTVEQVQAQGGRDLSRYPAVTDLYDKANGLRPKLAMSLDDAGRKEQMLSDMHDKLSQAVKLYDQLLSEQIAHPRWRAPQTVSSPVTYQPASSVYSTGYNSVGMNGYSQWAPATPAPTVAQYQSPQTQSPSSREESSQTSWYQPQQPQQQQQQQQQQYVPTAVSIPQQQYMYASSPTPSTSQTLPPVTYNPLSHAPIQSPPPPETTSVSLQQSLPPVQQYAAPVPQPVSAPTPLQEAQYVSSPGPVLQRHNTVSYVASPPAPINVNPNLIRSNTVSASHQQYAPQHQPQQQYAPPPSQLPQFPVAPTLNPASFPAVPSGFEQKERKEALLIDL